MRVYTKHGGTISHQIANTRTLDSHASRLRRKLGVAGERWIVNVWGVGYRLA
jgi:DNA-binding response OmpR family regulator